MKMRFCDVDALIDKASADGPKTDESDIKPLCPGFTGLMGERSPMFTGWIPVLIGYELNRSDAREAWMMTHLLTDHVEVPDEIVFGYVATWFAFLDGGKRTAWVSIPSMTNGVIEGSGMFSPGPELVSASASKDEILGHVVSGYKELQANIGKEPSK